MYSTIDRFLSYVKIDTTSDENSNTSPSTLKQHKLAGLLKKECEEIGLSEITYDEKHCYVYATIPASIGYENVKTLGFIAHMDTSPAASGENIKADIVKNYKGEDILLNKDKGIVMSVKEFPELLKLKGDDLIVTDGTTLLGADDKAGVSEIMGMADFLMKNKDIKHGKIRIAFTPDEEIGCGTDYFDVDLFGASYGYTVDGGALGEIECENFNAASGKMTFNGRSVHPGSAKNKMKNAVLMAYEFQGLLPVWMNPMYTEGYEGFFHLDAIEGNVEKTVCHYIIRDHDRQAFEEKKQIFKDCAEFINKKFGEGSAVCEVKDSYYNMKEVLGPHMHLVDNAAKCMESLGIEPVIVPIRGGTDGARLSFMGLPCPNLCTGGGNYHGRFEYASINSMEKTTSLLIELCKVYGERQEGQKSV